MKDVFIYIIYNVFNLHSLLEGSNHSTQQIKSRVIMI